MIPRGETKVIFKADRIHILNSFHEILIIKALNEKRLVMVLYKISR